MYFILNNYVINKRRKSESDWCNDMWASRQPLENRAIDKSKNTPYKFIDIVLDICPIRTVLLSH